MSDDIEAVAGRLTEAQRRAVLALSGEFSTPPRGLAYWAGTLLYGPKVAEFRHATWSSSKRLYRLTDLGLAVRSHLRASENQHDDRSR